MAQVVGTESSSYSSSNASSNRMEGSAEQAEHPYRARSSAQAWFFDEPELLRARVEAAFVRWARAQPMAPREVRGMVKTMTPRVRLVGRLHTEVEARKLMWRQRPYRGGDAATSTTVDVAKLDPLAEAAELHRASRSITTCGTCGGKEAWACARCDGSARVSCGSCGGEGQVLGRGRDGAPSKLPCERCGGLGGRPCSACRDGRVECKTCGGAGKLERWLVAEKTSRVSVQTRSDDGVHRTLARAAELDEAEGNLDVRVVGSVTRARRLTELDLPASVPSRWRAQHWNELQPQLQRSERVVSQRFQLVELPVVEVTYGFAGAEQVVPFEGTRLHPPPAAEGRLFQARASELRRYGWLLATAPVICWLIYAARGHGGSSLSLGAAASLLVMSSLLFLALGRKTLARPARGWALAALAPALGATVALVKLETSPLPPLRLGEARGAEQRHAVTAPAPEPVAPVRAQRKMEPPRRVMALPSPGLEDRDALRHRAHLAELRWAWDCRSFDGVAAALRTAAREGELARPAQRNVEMLAAVREVLALGKLAAAPHALRCASSVDRLVTRFFASEQAHLQRCLRVEDWACTKGGVRELVSLMGPEVVELRARLAQVRPERPPSRSPRFNRRNADALFGEEIDAGFDPLGAAR